MYKLNKEAFILKIINILFDHSKDVDQVIEEIYHTLQVEYSSKDNGLDMLYDTLVKIQDPTQLIFSCKNLIPDSLMQVIECFKKSSQDNQNIELKFCVNA